jgi:hypothetical protein
MSTNSGIALRSGDTYQTIYCHWDGYPEYMYPMLRDNYNSLELAAKLISYGDASSIEKKLEPDPSLPHSFDNYQCQDDVCVFYHRDRGDSWERCQPACYTLKELFSQSAFEYVYIFEDGEWNVYSSNGRKLNCEEMYER